MNDYEYKRAQQENFASRIGTLTALFNRIIEKSKKLDGYSAIIFTNPLAEILVKALRQLEALENKK